MSLQEVARIPLPPVEPVSRLLVHPDRDEALVLLASRGATGPWLVVDVRTGEQRTGRGLPVLHDVVDRTAQGLLLLTARGLTSVALGQRPHVLEHVRVPGAPGRAPQAHESVRVGPGRVLLGVRGRSSGHVVSTSDGSSTRTLRAAAPFLRLDGDRVWSLGSGTVHDLGGDRVRPAPRALAAVCTGEHLVAVLGEPLDGPEEGLGHALLRDLAPDRLLARLRGPWRDLRLARLDGALQVLHEARPPWLARAVDDPDWHPVRLTLDGADRAVLAGPRRLTVLDVQALERRDSRSTAGPPTCWPGRSQAVHLDGDALVLLAW